MFKFLKKLRKKMGLKVGPFTVVGIGQCSWDYLSIVDSYPEVDTKKEVLEFEEQGGGPVATALVTLSRLGIQVRFHGIIGDDKEGEKIIRSLQDENIDTEGLIKRPFSSSQIAHIVVGKNNSTRTIFWKRPSGEPLNPDELDDDFLSNVDFILLDGLMKDVSLFAAQKARERNIPVMLDAGRLRKGTLDIARLADYVIGSEEFAQELGWNNNPESFKQHILNLGLGITTITLGSRGSITFANNEIIEIPAFPVNVVDTTGAGDVFHGGYLYGLLHGWNFRETVQFASAVAALKCEAVGGRAGIPDLLRAIKFLNDRGYKNYRLT